MLAGIAKRFLICGLILIPLITQAALININTAGSVELQTLTGIGPSYAQRIIDYRSQKGLFQKIEDIKNVSGIGDMTFAKIKDSITIGDALSAEGDSSTSVSAHTSSEPLSAADVNINFKASAGRDRLGFVLMPMEFKATSNIGDANDFTWVFGDGSVGRGEVVTHSYAYPGEYAVVLNASYRGSRAVSRIEAKIVAIDLSVSFASPERIEVNNKGKTEVNLTGQALISKGRSFAFPEDTIIKAGQKISFPSGVTNLSPKDISEVSLTLINKLTNKTEPQITANIVKTVSTTDQTKIDAIYKQILALEIQEMDLKNKDKEASQIASPILAENALKTEKVTEGWFKTLKQFFGLGKSK